jgi:hypothetical protein
MPRPGLRPDGPKIRYIREDLRGLTLSETAKRMGSDRSPHSILMTEKYSRPISRVFASQLAKALSTPDERVTIDDITAKDDSESEPEPKALAS